MGRSIQHRLPTRYDIDVERIRRHHLDEPGRYMWDLFESAFEGQPGQDRLVRLAAWAVAICNQEAMAYIARSSSLATKIAIEDQAMEIVRRGLLYTDEPIRKDLLELESDEGLKAVKLYALVKDLRRALETMEAYSPERAIAEADYGYAVRHWFESEGWIGGTPRRQAA